MSNQTPEENHVLQQPNRLQPARPDGGDHCGQQRGHLTQVLMTPLPAPHLIRWFLRATGYAGICLAPWGIFILAEHMLSQRLIRHEQQHWRQWERMGTVRYYATYIWQVLRYGYRNAPMEIEARAAEQA